MPGSPLGFNPSVPLYVPAIGRSFDSVAVSNPPHRWLSRKSTSPVSRSFLVGPSFVQSLSTHRASFHLDSNIPELENSQVIEFPSLFSALSWNEKPLYPA